MRSLLLVAFALVSLLASPALALSEAPTGFADIAWGTTKDEVKKLLANKCRPLKEQQDSSLRCQGYDLAGVGKVDLSLDFVDQELRGYSIWVPMGPRQLDLYNAAMAKFGSPAIYPKAGAISPTTWAWPGGISTYMLLESTKQAILGVSQKALTEAKIKEWDEDRSRLKKRLGF